MTSTTIRAMPATVAGTTVHRGAVRPEDGVVASGGRVQSSSPLTFTGSPQEERAIRAHERRMIGSLLTAAISEKQHVSLQHALRKLDPEAARTAGPIVHLLTSILGECEQEAAA